MSKSIGGISLDDIYAASDDLNEEGSSILNEETAKNPEKKTVSSTAIGGIELDAIMAAADIETNERSTIVRRSLRLKTVKQNLQFRLRMIKLSLDLRSSSPKI